MTTAVDFPQPMTDPTTAGRARRVLITCTAALSVGALTVGWLEARLPLGPGNTAVHHGYPFSAVGLAVVLTLVACRAGRHAGRWSALLLWLAMAYAANGLLIALLSYAVTPAGHALPVPVLGWLADVVFPICDVAMLGLVVGMLPDARPRADQRRALTVLALLTGLTVMGEAFLPRTLDSTTVANPVGIDAASSWTGALQALIPAMFLYALGLSVVRSCQLARQCRRREVGGAAAAASAGVVLFGTFIAQSAVPESSPWAAGTITLVGCGTATVLASRVARSLSRTAAQEPAPHVVARHQRAGEGS